MGDTTAAARWNCPAQEVRAEMDWEAVVAKAGTTMYYTYLLCLSPHSVQRSTAVASRCVHATPSVSDAETPAGHNLALALGKGSSRASISSSLRIPASPGQGVTPIPPDSRPG